MKRSSRLLVPEALPLFPSAARRDRAVEQLQLPLTPPERFVFRSKPWPGPASPPLVRLRFKPIDAPALTRGDWDRVRRTLPDGRVMSRLEHWLRRLLMRRQ
jgi:hypothetical protein